MLFVEVLEPEDEEMGAGDGWEPSGPDGMPLVLSAVGGAKATDVGASAPPLAPSLFVKDQNPIIGILKPQVCAAWARVHARLHKMHVLPTVHICEFWLSARDVSAFHLSTFSIGAYRSTSTAQEAASTAAGARAPLESAWTTTRHMRRPTSHP